MKKKPLGRSMRFRALVAWILRPEHPPMLDSCRVDYQLLASPIENIPQHVPANSICECFAILECSRLHMQHTSVHPCGTHRCKSLKLYSLSASLTSFAWYDESLAWTICRIFRSIFGRLLSSLTSSTIPRTFCPKCSPISSKDVSVSSTVSWRSAACNTSESLMPPSDVRMCATPTKIEGNQIHFKLLQLLSSPIGWFM